MKSLLLGCCFVLFSINFLAGCQHTAEGINQDTKNNIKEMRKEINS